MYSGTIWKHRYASHLGTCQDFITQNFIIVLAEFIFSDKLSALLKIHCTEWLAVAECTQPPSLMQTTSILRGGVGLVVGQSGTSHLLLLSVRAYSGLQNNAHEDTSIALCNTKRFQSILGHTRHGGPLRFYHLVTLYPFSFASVPAMMFIPKWTHLSNSFLRTHAAVKWCTKMYNFCSISVIVLT